jgi:hypothetical protein
MAFIVETGAGVASANSYASVTYADAYFSDRSICDWSDTQKAKESALIKATDYIEMRFSQHWIGSPVAADQSLSWPRLETVGYDNSVPEKLKRAACEYALRALTSALAPDPVISDTGFSVVTTKEVVGPIEQSYEVVGGGNKTQPTLIRPYPTADYLLVSLLKTSNSVIR